jgi:Ion channel
MSAMSEAAPFVERRAPTGRRRERYAALLAFVVVAFAVQGIATPGRWGQVVVTVLLAVTLLLALLVAETRPNAMRAAVAVAVAVVVLGVVEAVAGNVENPAPRLASAFLVILTPPAVMVGVVRTLRATQAVTLEAILGVLSIYLLLGMFFAFVYGAIDRLGGPFFAQDVRANASRCLYYSFTTLTTVGYGDFTARSNLGHTLSVSEALTGQIYLVTIVSLVVANLGRRRSPQ